MIKDKIRKLLTLANDKAASEGEIQNAMKKVHALLSEHYLTLQDVELKESTVTKDIGEFEKHPPFKRTLYSITAKLYFCDYYYIHPASSVAYVRNVFIGETCNIETTKQMIDYFTKAIDNIVKTEAYGKGRRYVMAFRRGCYTRLCERIQEHIEYTKHNETITEGGNTLPVLADVYTRAKNEIEKYYQDNDIKLKTSQSNTRITSRDGYNQGRSAANKINLSNQLKG